MTRLPEGFVNFKPQTGFSFPISADLNQRLNNAGSYLLEAYPNPDNIVYEGANLINIDSDTDYPAIIILDAQWQTQKPPLPFLKPRFVPVGREIFRIGLDPKTKDISYIVSNLQSPISIEFQARLKGR